MATVETDIRIFRNKEMFSPDMAEIVDAALLKSGIIQGCTVSVVSGVLKISSGRIILKGRLGVVTAGDIEVPSLEQIQTCTLVAVCDLSSTTKPFYLALLDPTALASLQASATVDGSFNVSNGITYLVLGTASVDPATGLVSNWTADSDAVARKGPDIYEAMRKDFLKNYIIRKALNTGSHSAASGTGTISYTYTIPDNEIPSGYKPFDVRCATNGGGDGWWEFYPCSCDFNDSPTNKNVALRFQRRSGTGGTLYPWIVVTFVKDIT